MTDLSGYFEGIVQEWWSQNEEMPTPPSSVYIALHNGDEGNNPDGSQEVSAEDYSRVEVTSEDLEVTGDGPTRVENTAEISFGDPENDWGEVSHVSIWDGSSDTDNPLTVTGELPSSRSIDSDTDEVRFDAGDLAFNVD